MTSQLFAAGNYRFAPTPANSPYSAGVVAEPGYEIIRATLSRWLPWREGLAFVDRHLASLGRPRAALCAVELRCAEPYPPGGWIGSGSFNQSYVDFLTGWGLAIDGAIPVARTNVAPGINPPTEQVLHAFSYTVVSPSASPTFVVSGGAEDPAVRPGETSSEAMRVKALDMMADISSRLVTLGATWDQVNEVDLYTVHELLPYLIEAFLAPMGAAAQHGTHWFYSRPPITDREIEMDARCVRTNLYLSS